MKKTLFLIISIFVFVFVLNNLPIKNSSSFPASSILSSSTPQVFKIIDSEQLIRSKTYSEKISPAPETKFYQIPFSRITKDGLAYKDALVFSPEEYDKLTLDQINQMEDERFNNWLSLINDQSKAAAIYKP